MSGPDPYVSRRTVARGPDVVHAIEVKRSRFIALLRRVDDEAGARQLVADSRTAHPEARHHCSAWIIDVPGAQPVRHSSDDGEPSGTAGRPMLDVLTGSGLTDVATVVVRYFGGTLLGTGGLVRAYSEAVAGVLAAAPRVTLVRTDLWDIILGHAEAGRVEADLLARGAVVAERSYGPEGVRLRVADNDGPGLAGAVAAITRGAVTPTPAGSRVVETPVRPG